MFLVSDKYRTLRHLLLIFCVLELSLSFIWYTPVEHDRIYYKFYAWLCYVILFGGIIYTNIYISTPKLLLKDKVGPFILIIFVFSVIFIACIGLIQIAILSDNSRMIFNSFSYSKLTVNVLSASVILIFLFLGTTSMVLIKRWIIADMEKTELESSLLESELKLLKNQVNPHFLFNMLNNANMLLKKDKEQASDVLYKLEDLLRYQINDSAKEAVPLNAEILFLNDYLNLEKIRRDHFEYTIRTEGNVDNINVPPLLFIIFIENAIKHNPESENTSFVHIGFKIQDNELYFSCENSKPESPVLSISKRRGLGLKNIRRRLELLFPGRYDLKITDEQFKYSVKLKLSI